MQPAPAHLGALGSQMWEHACKHLLNYDMLTWGELAVLQLYAELWDEYQHATDELKKTTRGSRFIKGKGRQFVTAAAGYRLQILDRIIKIARDLGMTPASRSSLSGGGPAVEDDPLDILTAGE